jgi:hypothetical protein
MKVMVATTEMQGRRKNDFCHAEPPEFLMFGFECDGEAVDGACGCKRALVGISSDKATTTFQVVERVGMTLENYAEFIYCALERQGWTKLGDDWKKMARKDAEELARIASVFRLGAIVEKRGRKFQERRKAA